MTSDFNWGLFLIISVVSFGSYLIGFITGRVTQQVKDFKELGYKIKSSRDQLYNKVLEDLLAIIALAKKDNGSTSSGTE